MRSLVLLVLFIPVPMFAQSVPSSGPSCAPLLSTVEADPLGEATEYGAGFFRVDGTPPGPRVSAASTLELEIAGATRVRRGEPLNLSLRVTNRSQRGVVAMRAMDGSAEHWRSPSYDLYVREVGSALTYRWDFHGGRCGMTNAVSAEDYVPIAPGAVNTTLPGEWGEHLKSATLSVPGQYEAWVVYRMCGDIGNLGGAATPPGPTPTPGEYVSSAIRFRVR